MSDSCVNEGMTINQGDSCLETVKRECYRQTIRRQVFRTIAATSYHE